MKEADCVATFKGVDQSNISANCNISKQQFDTMISTSDTEAESNILGEDLITARGEGILGLQQNQGRQRIY
jgi:hypothetical protein